MESLKHLFGVDVGYLTQPIFSIIASVFSALIAVRLAYGRFKSERVWDTKKDIYSELLTSLNELNRYAAAFHQAEIEYQDTNNQYFTELNVQATELWKEIRFQISLGELFLSPSSVSILKSFDKKTSADTHDRFEHFAQLSSATEKVLTELLISARSDLGVPK